MSKREHITIIEPWKITAGEHAGKWLAGVQWTEGDEQKDRQIDRPRSTHHEAQRDADTLSRKIEVEGMQGDYPPLVTTQARWKADAAEVAGLTLTPTPPAGIDDGALWLDTTDTVNCACDGKVFLGADASDAVSKAIRHVKETVVLTWLSSHGFESQSLEEAGEALRCDIDDLRKLKSDLEEAYSARNKAVEARARAEKERDEALARCEVLKASIKRNSEIEVTYEGRALTTLREQRRTIKALEIALADAYGVAKT